MLCMGAFSSLFTYLLFLASWFDLDTEHNRWVYVSGLPSTTTVDEFVEIMSKYGVIMEDDNGELGGVDKGGLHICYEEMKFPIT